MMYVTPCSQLTDTQAIQTAVNMAAEKDIRTVVIPATKTWQLEKPVYLPNGITLILDGAQICAAGTAFTNANGGQADKMCLGGEQEHIYLLGTKGAAITGKNAPQVYFNNVKEYGITGISFRGGEGLGLRHCRYGKVQRVQFFESRFGILLGEGCNNNLLEDIVAETREEAVLWSADDSTIWGRGADMYDSSLCRLDAKTQGAPAVAVYTGPVAVKNLYIRDVTDRTEKGGVTVQLGKEGNTELVDLTVRGVVSSRTAVVVGENCDGVFLGNLQGGSAVVSPDATRILVDDGTEEIAAPQFPNDTDRGYVDANDPRYAGATDSETLQNAIDHAVGRCLVIPRYNARTGSRVWNVEKTLRLPSNTTLILLDAHLRLGDFTYCNMFTNAEKPACNIRICGVGSATVDSGKPNGLKAKNANIMGFGPITDNALGQFAGVDGLTVENLNMVQNRWYGILCVGCTNARLGNLNIYAPPIYPELGCIRLHSGCRDVLIENITGLTGENTVVISAESADDSIFRGESTDIMGIRIRTVKTDVSRCCMVNLKACDGRKIHHVLVENLLDCSLPEQKKHPYACVQVGNAVSDNLSDITLRDMTSRGVAAVQVGGGVNELTVSNIHSYGSSESALRTMPQPECYDYLLSGILVDLVRMNKKPRATVKNWHVNGVFFRCQQASRYMRGTATSIITDKKKFVGTVADLGSLWGENILLENVLADRAGSGIRVTGKASVEVRNFQASQIGRETAVCGSCCHLTVNGEAVPVTDTREL